MERYQQDIHYSNNTQLEMAIADLFHAESLADGIANSTHFALVIWYLVLVVLFTSYLQSHTLLLSLPFLAMHA